ncbi:MAG TPA: hypothetical protein VF902_00840 [Coriobacteriia bacterium]
MPASRGRTSRAAAFLIAAVVVLGVAMGPPSAAATGYESGDVPLKVYKTVVYNSVIGILIDGIILNDSGRPIDCVRVKATWPSGKTAEGWPTGELAPGEWTAFHIEWPDGLPTSAGLPAVTANGAPGDFQHYELTYTPPVLVSGPGASYRSYVTTVTNPVENGVPVSSIEIGGFEQHSGGQLADAVFSWFPSEQGLAPGESVEVQFHAKNMGVSPSVAVTSLRVTAKEQPVVSLAYDTLTPSYGQPITFRIDLARSDGTLITGPHTVKIYYSTDGGENWDYRYFQTDTGTRVVPFLIDRPTKFKAWFWSDGEFGTAGGEIVEAKPQVAVLPPSAPSAVRVSRPFKVRGVLNGGAASSGKPVSVQCYRKVGSRWALKTSVRAYPSATGVYARSLSLRQRGYWRIRAFRSGAGYTPYRYLRVK